MDCESGKACNMALSAPDYTSQGSQFLGMNAKYHGGRRSRKMRRMQGGSMAELASYPTSFEPSILPGDLHQTAGVAPLDKAIADLAQFRQAGGRRKTRRSRGGSLGYAPIQESSGPLISADMAKYTFQNPQWYDENLVNPNFQGPSVPKIGGSRKHRKGSRKHRKGSRKHRKGSRKHRKGSRKHRKSSRKH